MDIQTAAARLGIRNDDEAKLRADLTSMLDRLTHDVDGDQDISDGHPRFGEHVAILGIASDLDPAYDVLLDTMSWQNIAEGNAVERRGIDMVRTRFL